MKAALSIIPALAALIGLMLVSAHTYWRDAGEFILSAIYLDIAHPAGFPLFAQLGNLFSLLPFGPLAWRVNSFCYILAVANLALLGYLTFLCCTIFLNLRKLSSTILGFGASLSLLMTPSFLRQAFTAEVYNLHLFFVLSLLLLYARFQRSRDLRLLLLCAFLGGLGLGNHASLAVILLPAVLIVCSDTAVLRRCFLPGLLLGLVGLSVYAYLPVRATTALPLNTGEVVSFERLINHLTVARDRELRTRTSETLDASIVHGQILAGEKIWNQMRRDSRVIVSEFGLPIIALGVAGLILLMAISPRFGFVASATALSTWLFFLGWDPDPWGALFAMIALGAAFAIGTVLLRLELDERAELGSIVSVVLAVLAFRLNSAELPSIAELRTNDAPVTAARSLLSTTPRNSIYLTEAGWFLAAYAQYVEGLRPDVSLVYQPSILFPEYFARIELETSKSHYDSWGSTLPNDPDMRLAVFTDQLTRASTVAFEPNMRINSFFKTVTTCNAEGETLLLRGSAGGCGQEFREAQARELNELQKKGLHDWIGFRSDTAHYFESQLTTTADLLVQAGAAREAITLFESVCGGQHSLCSTTSYNNLAAYYLDAQRYEDAARVLMRLQHRRTSLPAAVRQNLEVAIGRLDSGTVAKLRQEVQQER